MRRKEVQDEFKKLVESGKIDEKILYHPSFLDVFSDMIVDLIDYPNYSIRLEDNSIIAEVNYAGNNVTDYAPDGFKGTRKYIIKMEKDNDTEYLTLKTESADIDVYNNRNDNNLTYSSSICAYDDRGYEVGRVWFHRSQKVTKDYEARHAFHNTWLNPKLYVKCATRGFVEVPFDMSDSNDLYIVRTRIRHGDGVCYKEDIRHNNRLNVEKRCSFGSISTERPEQLRSDNDFAYMINDNMQWKNSWGIDISYEQVRDMIQEANQRFSIYSHRGR